MSSSNYSQVYFVWDGKLVKIGQSSSSKTRMPKIKTDCAGFVFMGCIVTPFYEFLEKRLHSMFHFRRAVREWFELTREEVRFIIKCWDSYVHEVIRFKKDEQALCCH